MLQKGLCKQVAEQFKRVKDHRYLYTRGSRFYFRRSIPDTARSAFDGKREVQISLGEVSLAKARHLLTEELARFEEKLGAASGMLSPVAQIQLERKRMPSKEQIDARVRLWLKERLERDYISPANDAEAISEAKDHLANLEASITGVQRGIAFGASEPSLSTEWIAEALVEQNGWQVDKQSDAYRHLIRSIGRGQVEWAHQRALEIRGEPRSVLDQTFSAEEYRRDDERRRAGEADEPVSLSILFEGYLGEATLAPATVKAWRRFIEAFIAFHGNDDASKVTLAHVVAWKEHLLTTPKENGTPRAAKTVRDTYLAALKAVYRWAAENGKVPNNPAAAVRVIGRSGKSTRSKGLNDEEAGKILAATFEVPPTKLSVERARARRWVPWLCAYMGARVNEITQLRAEDVRCKGGIWTIHITPEAGSTKNCKAREVALHPHIIEQGFLVAIKGLQGAIFYDPARHRGGKEGNPQYKKVGEHLARWVRSLGVTHPEVQPNHGWRHRFKSEARIANMDNEIRDVIQGHRPRTEGEDYGDTFPVVSLRELKKLRRYPIQTPTVQVQNSGEVTET